jgi:hypothetical protein
VTVIGTVAQVFAVAANLVLVQKMPQAVKEGLIQLRWTAN